uniref:Uncharacterized protein n=1 Tax=Anguilla anguilla TaxID=7936 RepID=A0A0E9WAJ9_ANGAN
MKLKKAPLLPDLHSCKLCELTHRAAAHSKCRCRMLQPVVYSS